MPAIPSTLTLHGTPSSPGGRHLRAAQPFKPGDTIACFTEPCIAIPSARTQTRVCNSCLLPSNTPPRLCTGCKAIAYCSVACQKADWSRVHKEECKVFKRVQCRAPSPVPPTPDRVLPTPVRALVQLLLRSEEMESSTGLKLESHIEDFRGYVGDQKSEWLGVTSWSDLEVQAWAALNYLKRDNSTCNLTSALEAVCKLQVNAFSRLDPDSEADGLYMHPGLAMANHSCTPSAHVQFIGRRAVLKAYRFIQKDEEVTITYTGFDYHRETRQKMLKEGYHFQCRCSRCEDNLDVYEVAQAYPHLDLNRLSLTPDLSIFRNPLTSGSFRLNGALQCLAEDIYPDCMSPLTSTDSVGRAEIIKARWEKCAPLRQAELYAVEPLARVLSEAAIHFNELGAFSYALAITCFLALNCDPFIYPMPFHPHRVKVVLTICRLISNVGEGYTKSAAGQGGDMKTRPLERRIKHVFDAIDPFAVAQGTALLGAWWGPKAHSEEWRPYQDTVLLLNDLEEIVGRNDVKKMLSLWLKGGQDIEAQLFFEHAVLKPVQEFASIALDIMDNEFGAKRSLARGN
ncbi:SET and MYND [Apiospora kogelbergensis]|uniref:SET and MYND n=1 Tax=Apiospora kogelbergensis TaxID=1337665 RepID=A0AAW0QRK4_9PEZI